MPSDAVQPEQAPRRRPFPGRSVAAIAAVVVVLAAPVVFLAFDGDDGSDRAQRRVSTDPLATVRAAVGRTVSAGGYEMDTVSTNTQANGPGRYEFRTHTIVNADPYAMTSRNAGGSFSGVTIHVNSTHVWQLGAATAGYGPGLPGVLLTEYRNQVVGTLGSGPGALAMIGLASASGQLNLQEESVATATPSGTGSVDGIAVTYYDVTIDLTKLVDVPTLTDVQRETIAAVLPLLGSSGYRGTEQRIGLDADGYIREVFATTSFADGSRSERHSIITNIGCATKVYMPNETPGPESVPGPCVVPTTASTNTSTTAAIAPSTTTTTTATTPSTTTASPTSSTSAPPPTTSASPTTTSTDQP